MALADDEFDMIERELFRGFDKLTEEFDRIFNYNVKESGFSESYAGVRTETIREDVDIILYGSYPVNLRPNKKTRVRKIRRNVKPVSVQRRNHLTSYYDQTDDNNTIGSAVPLSRMENEAGRDSLEDVIVTDKNIKVVSQLPINNKRENIKVAAYNDNSVTISHLSSEGKRCGRTSVVPYNIDIETARSTYRNGIL
jgi:HSP20 family molecular chaperone IbpA